MGIHKVTLEMVLHHTTKAQPVCTRAWHARADENSGLLKVVKSDGINNGRKLRSSHNRSQNATESPRLSVECFSSCKIVYVFSCVPVHGTPLDQNRSASLLELELQPGPLQEQQALLAADPSLQPRNVYVDKYSLASFKFM